MSEDHTEDTLPTREQSALPSGGRLPETDDPRAELAGTYGTGVDHSACGYSWGMGPRHAVLGSVVLLTALGLAGCSSDPTSGASAVPSGPPQTEAPTSACGAMDAVLVEALAQTPE